MTLLSLGGIRAARRSARALAALQQAASPFTDPLSRWYVAAAEATLAINACRFAEGYDRATEALRLAEHPGMDAQWERGYARTMRAYGQLYLGRYTELLAETREAIADARSRRDRWLESLLRINVAPYSAYSRNAGFDAVRAELEFAFEPWRARAPGFIFSNWFLVSNNIDVAQWRWQAVLTRYREQQRALAQSGAWHMEISACWLHGGWAVAQLQRLAEVNHPDARIEAVRAARRLGRIPSPLAQGFHQLVIAQLGLASRNDAEAEAAAKAAEAAFAKYGAESLVAAARVLRGSILGGSEGQRLTLFAHAFFSRELPQAEAYLAGVVPLAPRRPPPP